MEISVKRRLLTAIICAEVGTKPVSASTMDPTLLRKMFFTIGTVEELSISHDERTMTGEED